MAVEPFPIGSRVRATIGGAGVPRLGRVSGILHYSWVNTLGASDFGYMVTFDGDTGQSGPCVAYRAEDEREAESANIGSAA